MFNGGTQSTKCMPSYLLISLTKTGESLPESFKKIGKVKAIDILRMKRSFQKDFHEILNNVRTSFEKGK